MDELLEFNPIQEAANTALEIAAQVEVSDASTAEAAKGQAVELKQIEAKIEDLRKNLVKPYNDRVKAINDTAKKISAPIEAGKKAIANKIVSWQTEERMKAEAEAEQRRKDAEAEAERVRQNDESTLEDVAKAEVKVEIASAPVKLSGAMKTISTREIWKFRIVDANKIPREYLQPNEVLIGSAVRGGLRILDGVEIYSESSAVIK